MWKSCSGGFAGEAPPPTSPVVGCPAVQPHLLLRGRDSRRGQNKVPDCGDKHVLWTPCPKKMSEREKMLEWVDITLGSAIPSLILTFILSHPSLPSTCIHRLQCPTGQERAAQTLPMKQSRTYIPPDPAGDGERLVWFSICAQRSPFPSLPMVT